MSCTIGAEVFSPGREFVLFKNKDFPRKHFTDRLVIEDEVFGVRGLHLPPGGPVGADQFSGFSIGANRAGVCACNSHVRSVEGGANYDELTEAAVRGTTTVAEAIAAVLAAAETGQWNWANIIVAALDGLGVVEIAHDRPTQVRPDRITRANGHLLPHRQRPVATPCARARTIASLIRQATSLAQVMAACRWHHPQGSDYDICAHDRGGGGNTVDSYIMHWREGQLTLYVHQGQPCRGEYTPIALHFPLDAARIKAIYPARENASS